MPKPTLPDPGLNPALCGPDNAYVATPRVALVDGTLKQLCVPSGLVESVTLPEWLEVEQFDSEDDPE